VVDRHAVAEEPVDGNVREELRIQVQPPFDKPETVECHGFDDVAVGDVVLPHLGDGMIDDPGDAEGVKAPATIPR
jgi:hypothetical protein